MSAKKDPAPKRGAGRPKAPARKRAPGAGRPMDPEGMRREKPIQFRAFGEDKERWEGSARDARVSFSKWARDGLDAWTKLVTHATELGISPETLLADLLENHARVRSAVTEFGVSRELSKTEERVLRILAPAEWARRFSK